MLAPMCKQTQSSDVLATNTTWNHDDGIKWKHFPRYWPSVPGIHRSPVNSPHKGQWRGALMFSLICVPPVWIFQVEANYRFISNKMSYSRIGLWSLAMENNFVQVLFVYISNDLFLYICDWLTYYFHPSNSILVELNILHFQIPWAYFRIYQEIT